MEKYLFIGDSHQSALLPIKMALSLGIPFLMGKGYCSSTDWPNVSRFDGNGNGDGIVMVMRDDARYICTTDQGQENEGLKENVR